MHDIGPMELCQENNRLRGQRKAEEFFTEEEHVKSEETNKTSSITKNLTTDDIKLLYLGKVLDECDDVTLFELEFHPRRHDDYAPPSCHQTWPENGTKVAGLTTS